MPRRCELKTMPNLVVACVIAIAAPAGRTQTQPPPPDHPAVTVQGITYTPRSILARNMGTPEDQTTAFPPHKIIGNIYYVGTRTLSSFLVTTPQGNILIDSTYERNVLTIRRSIEQLGFKFSDTKILLGNHAHTDHQEGDALVKADDRGTSDSLSGRCAGTPGYEARREGNTRSTRFCMMEML